MSPVAAATTVTATGAVAASTPTTTCLRVLCNLCMFSFPLFCACLPAAALLIPASPNCLGGRASFPLQPPALPYLVSPVLQSGWASTVLAGFIMAAASSWLLIFSLPPQLRTEEKRREQLDAVAKEIQL